MVHRMVREYGKSQEVVSTLNKSFQTLPANLSVERRAIDAERGEKPRKKAEYMEDYVGEEYDAVVLCGEIWPLVERQIRWKA